MADLLTVAQIADGDEYPFTRGQIRRWLFERRRNGLASAVVKPSPKRLYLNKEAFDAWLLARTQELGS